MATAKNQSQVNGINLENDTVNFNYPFRHNKIYCMVS